jgi:ribosomal protein S18 acetylase RimI-like enzyme
MAALTPRRLVANDPALADVLALIRTAFAYMDGIIDPPSSMHSLTPDTLARSGEVWAIGHPPLACAVFTPKPHALYIGRLAVAPAARGQGHARALMATAEARARALHLPALELQTRVELTANHATFRALGFTEIARTAHAGYDRPTSITMRRPVIPHP